jgi:hypothetical protein
VSGGPVITGLETVVDLRSDARDPSRMSVSARHAAVLADGRRIVLLVDRGWSSSGNAPDIWALTTVRDIQDEARTVVGPDEPPEGRSHAELAHDHWVALSETLRREGVLVDAEELRQLPHDVVLSEGLRALLAR